MAKAMAHAVLVVAALAAFAGPLVAQPSAGFPPAETPPPAPAPAPPPAAPPAYPPPAYPQPPPPAYPQPPPPAYPQPPPPAYAPPVTPTYGPYNRPPWQPKDEVAEREEYVRVGPPGIREHDGLYLRFAGGLGIGRDRAESSEDFENIATGDADSFDGAGSAFSAATEVAIGFTPVRGLVLGLAVYTATIPSLEIDSSSIAQGSYEYEVSQLAIFSPHVDFYLDPDRGLHFQGGFGFATYIAGQAYPTNGPDARAHTATGMGFMLGAGHDWWVGDQWSLGLLARVLYAWTSGSDPESVDWTHKTLAPTLLVTATYH